MLLGHMVLGCPKSSFRLPHNIRRRTDTVQFTVSLFLFDGSFCLYSTEMQKYSFEGLGEHARDVKQGIVLVDGEPGQNGAQQHGKIEQIQKRAQ